MSEENNGPDAAIDGQLLGENREVDGRLDPIVVTPVEEDSVVPDDDAVSVGSRSSTVGDIGFVSSGIGEVGTEVAKIEGHELSRFSALKGMKGVGTVINGADVVSNTGKAAAAAYRNEHGQAEYDFCDPGMDALQVLVDAERMGLLMTAGCDRGR